ncbi:hypothetical protein PT974_07548 [Cladobotryum mycophilum]|uniref:Heterokaryon incompatibility domain-containing protein n=1 Tax=Cladobotryum mycophilum TaxID=491253 RepID=A0ABR0SPJ6_9HYPO
MRVGYKGSLLAISDLQLANAPSYKNAVLHDQIWKADADYELQTVMKSDTGFLSQLAHLCIRAGVQLCEQEACLRLKNDMRFTAPKCGWDSFREWALTSMSCQTNMDHAQKLSQIAWTVSGCCMVLKKCVDDKADQERFVPFLDGDDGENPCIDLVEVSNIIYWMVKIQSQIGIGPKRFGHWNHQLLPAEVTIPSIEVAAQTVEDLKICKNRLWNLVNISDRKQSDLSDIVYALKRHKAVIGHEEHEFCTPSKCQLSHMDNTHAKQLHKCNQEESTAAPGMEAKGSSKDVKNHMENTFKGGSCIQMEFPIELLETALKLGESTAWLCPTTQIDSYVPRLSALNNSYMAISHVWSDGTGVGVKAAGTVNSCLFDALWWDAISIPKERKAHSKALNKMQSVYANTNYTVVHDSYLLNFPWKNDSGLCLALVLSAWFTRGWTALELAVSKNVKVLFKDPNSTIPLIKDLDADILAKSPVVSSRAHWLATTMIQ